MIYEKINRCKKYCDGCHYKGDEFKGFSHCNYQVGQVTVAAGGVGNLGMLEYTARHICRGLMIKKYCPFWSKHAPKYADH